MKNRLGILAKKQEPTRGQCTHALQNSKRLAYKLPLGVSTKRSGILVGNEQTPFFTLQGRYCDICQRAHHQSCVCHQPRHRRNCRTSKSEQSLSTYSFILTIAATILPKGRFFDERSAEPSASLPLTKRLRREGWIEASRRRNR